MTPISTTHGSRFIISQLHGSPVRVNNYALYGESQSLHGSREASPGPPRQSGNSGSNLVYETSLYNQQINVAPPFTPEAASSLNHSSSQSELTTGDIRTGASVSPAGVMSPVLSRSTTFGTRSCYYRTMPNNVLEIFYPDLNQLFKYSYDATGGAMEDRNLKPCGKLQQNLAGQHQQKNLPVAPFTPYSDNTCEWKPFAVPSLPSLRPNICNFDSNLATGPPPRSPQWMSKLVDNRSSADAEFHTRFPMPNNQATKSPGRKKKWISQTTSTINSVFDLVKQSESNLEIQLKLGAFEGYDIAN